jgi:calcium/calmodulin-dependent protein kinase I
MTEEDVIGM